MSISKSKGSRKEAEMGHSLYTEDKEATASSVLPLSRAVRIIIIIIIQ